MHSDQRHTPSKKAISNLFRLRSRQKIILEFVYAYTQAHTHAPSIREIGRAAEITSTSVVNYNVKQLVRWGFLEKTRGGNRTIRLTTSGYHAINQPPPQAMQSEIIRLQMENQMLLERYQQLKQYCDALEQRPTFASAS